MRGGGDRTAARESRDESSQSDRDRALLLIDRALEIDENLAVAWQRRGWVCGYAGDSEGAIASLQRAVRLNPLDPRVFLTHSAMGFAHFIAGRNEEAAGWAAMALRVKPHWPPALRVALVANASGGRTDETQRIRNTCLDIDPGMSISKICGCYPLRQEADRQRLIEGLRKAGVPEASRLSCIPTRKGRRRACATASRSAYLR